jgi:hypothetical protein
MNPYTLTSNRRIAEKNPLADTFSNGTTRHKIKASHFLSTAFDMDSKNLQNPIQANLTTPDVMSKLTASGQAQMTAPGSFRIPLSPNPPEPVEKSNVLDEQELNRWISAHPKPLRQPLNHLSSSIKHIPYSEFRQNFADGIDSFNKKFVSSTSDPLNDYLVFVEPHKSNQWLAELAYPDLIQKPNQVLPLGKKGSDYIHYLQGEKNSPTPYFPSTVVFFDDGIYSGKQMSTFIEGIIQATHTFNNERSSRGDDPVPVPHVTVIAPYATEFGEKLIFEKNKNVAIDLSPHQRIVSLAEVTSPLDQKILEGSLWKSDPRDEQGAFTRPYQRGMESRGNIWFDHKIPNWLSFAFPLEEGVVTGVDGEILNGTIADPSDDPSFTPNGDVSYKPIPKTVPPYKKRNDAV